MDSQVRSVLCLLCDVHRLGIATLPLVQSDEKNRILFEPVILPLYTPCAALYAADYNRNYLQLLHPRLYYMSGD